MKYLHSGYILFCERAEHTEDGKVNTVGLFDLFVDTNLPIQLRCGMVISFGTPYERRGYKGLAVIEDPDGREVWSQEFSANDPNDLYRGHCILHPELTLNREGLWTVKVFLKNWKGEGVWDVQRQFWTMLEGDAPPDP